MRAIHSVSAFLLAFAMAACGDERSDPPSETDAAFDASAPEEAGTRTNFLLVVADDMGYTDVGAFGSEIETPNLDAIAARGIRLTDFHVSVSCSPTRSMLMSGIDNHQAGLGNMAELLTEAQRGQPGYEGHLNDRIVSLAEILQANGYRTYMAGKWHLGHGEGHRPRDRGFDRSLSMLYGGASHWNDMAGLIQSQTPAVYTHDGEELESLPADFYSSRSYADFLIESIRRERDQGRPFLAYLAFTAPHDPLHVPEPWLSKYRGRYDDGYEALKRRRATAAAEVGAVPGAVPLAPMLERTVAWESRTAEERAYQARMMEVYAGMVDNLDYHVGRVINFLRDIGQFENTVIIFFSDNGANPWRSEDYPGNGDGVFLSRFDQSLDNIGHPNSAVAYGVGWAQAGAGPFRYFKMTVGEGGIRSPFIAAGPGIQSGRSSDAFVTVLDVMPTLLEMADIEHPDRYEGREVLPMVGRSMVGLLSGHAEEVHSDDSYAAGEMLGGRYVRQGDYKAVFVASPHGPASWQLFDLAADPGETRDLAAQDPERLAAMREAYERYAEEVGVVPAGS